jgi:glycerophosphoryl diester phosphodiesterase
MSVSVYHAFVAWIVCAMTSPLLGQLIVAHRGASHDAPENTLAAFKLAVEQGADAFEADFFLTIDRHVICFHDKDTERIVGRKLSITQTPFDELRKMDVGSWQGSQWKGEPMPTLEEVLAAVPAGKSIFVELKSASEVVPFVAKAVKESSLSPDQVVIISFHEDAIAASKTLMPHIKAYWLTDFKKQEDGTIKPTAAEVIATLQRTGADALDGRAMPEHFDSAFVQKLRDAGFDEFHVWTVDEPEVANFYRKLGVTSITTNRPGWLREQLEKPAVQ